MKMHHKKQRKHKHYAPNRQIFGHGETYCNPQNNFGNAAQIDQRFRYRKVSGHNAKVHGRFDKMNAASDRIHCAHQV